MSETPRTDAAIHASRKHPYRDERQRELHEFARTLERENAALRAICTRLAEFDRKYPKGRIYSASEMAPEKELDAIVEDAKALAGEGVQP
jgi:hypothetical protein